MGFFADDVSEELQTEGRTGRAGAKGEFYLILDRSRLVECFSVTDAELDAQAEGNGMFAMLDQKRQAKSKKTCEKLDKAVVDAKTKHSRTVEYQNALMVAAANGSSANIKACVDLLANI
jgi:superfamily II DNA/RNA helicase